MTKQETFLAVWPALADMHAAFAKPFNTTPLGSLT